MTFPETEVKRGIYHGISNHDYHSGQGVSRSAFDAILRSPAHFWEAYVNPTRKPFEPTKDMIIGSIAHTLVLEPDQFESEYAIAPKCDRRTKIGKQIWAEFNESAGDKTVVTIDGCDIATRVANAIRNHPTASKLLTGGSVESSVYWDDFATGIQCKARPDYLTESAIVDLKTTVDASPGGFAKSCANFGYHRQAAWYGEGVRVTTGYRPPFVFIAVEKVPPFAIGIYTMDSESLGLGLDECRRALDTLSECRNSNEWPSYGTKVQSISLPKWAFNAGG